MFLSKPSTPFIDSLAKYRELPTTSNPSFSTGIPIIDKLFSSRGFEAGMYLLAGDPGCGKTTLALQLMQALIARGHVAVYAAYEGMRNVHSAMRRLKLEEGIVVIDQRVEGWEPEASTLVKRMYQFSAENYTGKPLVMCIDSIKNLGTGSIAARKKAAIELYEACTHTNTILLIIAHATKESIGKKNKRLEGPAELVGQADALIYLIGSEPVDGVRPISIDTTQKNRLGAPGVYSGLSLTASGFVWSEAAKSPTVAEMDAEIAAILAPLQRS